MNERIIIEGKLINTINETESLEKIELPIDNIKILSAR